MRNWKYKIKLEGLEIHGIFLHLSRIFLRQNKIKGKIREKNLTGKNGKCISWIMFPFEIGNCLTFFGIHELCIVEISRSFTTLHWEEDFELFGIFVSGKKISIENRVKISIISKGTANKNTRNAVDLGSASYTLKNTPQNT